jgi:hypothetical protein
LSKALCPPKKLSEGLSTAAKYSNGAGGCDAQAFWPLTERLQRSQSRVVGRLAVEVHRHAEVTARGIDVPLITDVGVHFVLADHNQADMA